MHDIPSFEDTYSYATGINDHEQVAGYFTNPNVSNFWRVFRKSPDTDAEDVGIDVAVADFNVDTNDLGHITGKFPCWQQRFCYCFFWNGAGLPRDLGTVPGGSSSFGIGVNNSDQVTGYFWTLTAGHNIQIKH